MPGDPEGKAVDNKAGDAEVKRSLEEVWSAIRKAEATGHPEDLDEARRKSVILVVDHKEAAFDLFARMERLNLEQMAAQIGGIWQSVVLEGIERLRQELGYADASPAIRLAITRVLVSSLRVQVMEEQLSKAATAGIQKKAHYTNIHNAQRLLSDALKTLQFLQKWSVKKALAKPPVPPKSNSDKEK